MGCCDVVMNQEIIWSIFFYNFFKNHFEEIIQNIVEKENSYFSRKFVKFQAKIKLCQIDCLNMRLFLNER